MEPRPLRRGNSYALLCRRRGQHGFNGATSIQTWKPSQTFRRVPSRLSSMEPHPFRRGNRTGAISVYQHVRFNGATSFQTWKHAPCRRYSRSRRSFNEATSFQTWKLAVDSSEQSRTVLQWSHVLSDVETNTACHRTLPERASMEPRPFRRGNARSVRRSDALVVASMEPRPFRRGNAHDGQAATHGNVASMEPRPFRRGNLQLRPLTSQTMQSLQWSHVLSNVETASSPRCYTGHTTGFNGATSFRTWKRACRIARCRERGASMEPRPFERGNGSQARQPRWMTALQWSHVLSNVETYVTSGTCSDDVRFNGATSFRTWKLHQVQLIIVSGASMEPRPFERGNADVLGTATCKRSFNGATSFQTWKPLAVTACDSCRIICFNGATSFQTWKHRRPCCTLPDACSLLQWSHVLPDVETSTRCRAMQHAGRTASMEPRPFRRGNRARCARHADRTRFNGATSFQTWKRLP